MVKRFEVYLINLDPTVGSEIQKTRPAVVISPDEMNSLNTVVVAPMTTKGKDYPSRINVTFIGKKGKIILDQIRTVDKSRLVKKLGIIDHNTGVTVLKTLQEMFAY